MHLLHAGRMLALPLAVLALASACTAEENDTAEQPPARVRAAGGDEANSNAPPGALQCAGRGLPVNDAALVGEGGDTLALTPPTSRRHLEVRFTAAPGAPARILRLFELEGSVPGMRVQAPPGRGLEVVLGYEGCAVPAGRNVVVYSRSGSGGAWQSLTTTRPSDSVVSASVAQQAQGSSEEQAAPPGEPDEITTAPSLQFALGTD